MTPIGYVLDFIANYGGPIIMMFVVSAVTAIPNGAISGAISAVFGSRRREQDEHDDTPALDL
ncbi:hypothetical protein [Caballeronia sordidicola]|uniref:hypothetical protein n=1 Tax=Caballeronia sordidicola TaxID=196367 RepID=UPI0004D01F0C|nr:hypothetical protein [Caballeronia sordidicola]